jgi:hypothetical protein
MYPVKPHRRIGLWENSLATLITACDVIHPAGKDEKIKFLFEQLSSSSKHILSFWVITYEIMAEGSGCFLIYMEIYSASRPISYGRIQVRRKIFKEIVSSRPSAIPIP